MYIHINIESHGLSPASENLALCTWKWKTTAVKEGIWSTNEHQTQLQICIL